MHDLPPTDSEFAPGPPVPGWPKGIGITSIVLAGLGLCCGVCGVGMMFAQGPLMKMAEKEMGTPPDVMFASPGQMLLAAAGVPFTLVLLFAGIAWPVFTTIWFGLMKKRPEVGAPDQTVI